MAFAASQARSLEKGRAISSKHSEPLNSLSEALPRTGPTSPSPSWEGTAETSAAGHGFGTLAGFRRVTSAVFFAGHGFGTPSAVIWRLPTKRCWGFSLWRPRRLERQAKQMLFGGRRCVRLLQPGNRQDQPAMIVNADSDTMAPWTETILYLCEISLVFHSQAGASWKCPWLTQLTPLCCGQACCKKLH